GLGQRDGLELDVPLAPDRVQDFLHDAPIAGIRNDDDDPGRFTGWNSGAVRPQPPLNGSDHGTWSAVVLEPFGPPAPLTPSARGCSDRRITRPPASDGQDRRCKNDAVL